MKKKMKSILAIGIVVLTLTNAIPIFAAGVREISKDSSVLRKELSIKMSILREH